MLMVKNSCGDIMDQIPDIHPLEQQLINVLNKGMETFLADLGGVAIIQESLPEIVHSPLLPEFIRILLKSILAAEDVESCLAIVIFSVKNISDSLVMDEIVEIVHSFRPFPSDTEHQIFLAFLVVSGDPSVAPMVRAKALDGAFRFVEDDISKRYALLAQVVGVRDDDNAEYLRHAAKIIGISYSLWRVDGLKNRLDALAHLDGSGDESAFELGMANLVEGLDATNVEEISEKFLEARQWFDVALQIRCNRPDAVLYLSALQAIDEFSREANSKDIVMLASRISENAFELFAWHNNADTPSWLGARFSEMALWYMLSLRLVNFVPKLQEPAWFNPKYIIENFLVHIVSASRSVLKRENDSGIETLLVPPIRSVLVRERGLRHIVNQWVEENTNHPASLILARLVEESKQGALITEQITESGNCCTPANIDWNARKEGFVAWILAAQYDIQPALSSPDVEPILHDCFKSLSALSQFQQTDVQHVVMIVLYQAVCFLVSRTDGSIENSKRFEYLFKKGDGSHPTENALQDDFHDFLVGNLGDGPSITCESRGIGGGRADILVSLPPYRLIIEIKRERSDASFETLIRNYQHQTVEYQNTNLRLGILMVLDLTDKIHGVAHVRDQVHPVVIRRPGESLDRGLVVVRIPGNRLSPSKLLS
ncbi:MAG: hypothetical protein HQL64_12925 [Magnetococcales bacterium]|nr:hypothetical protein [Magnetococcales bacterium]